MIVKIEFEPSFGVEDMKKLLRDVKEAYPVSTVVVDDRGITGEEIQGALNEVFPEWAEVEARVSKPEPPQAHRPWWRFW